MSTKSIIQPPRWEFPAPLAQAVQSTLKDWQANRKMARLWNCDAPLWTGDDESKWLGWLRVVEDQRNDLQQLLSFAADVAGGDFTHTLLLGMGGSSLCPEVLKITFGRQPGYPELHVLDSTDPAQIKAIEARIDLARTLFIVACKRSSTRKERATGLSPSPIPARKCSRWRRAIVSARSSSGCPASAVDTQH